MVDVHHGAAAHQSPHALYYSPLMFDPHVVKDAVFVLKVDGQDGACGWPGCVGTITCASGPFLPDELNGILTLNEFRDFCAKVSILQIYHHGLLCVAR